MVTRYISVSRRVPIIPIGSRMPWFLSTEYSCGIAWSSSRSCGTGCARATSLARSTSALEISSPFTATMPLLIIASTCSPAIPAYTPSTCTPAIRSASRIAFWMDCVVSLMSETTPRRIARGARVAHAENFQRAVGRITDRFGDDGGSARRLCRGRRPIVRDSLRPGDDLITKAQIELGHACLSAREIRLDGNDVGKPLRGDARERAYLGSG